MRTPLTAPFVSRAAVHARTQELAMLAGRAYSQVSQDDYEQAKREITGESEIDRQNAALDSQPVTPSPARRTTPE